MKWRIHERNAYLEDLSIFATGLSDTNITNNFYDALVKHLTTERAVQILGTLAEADDAWDYYWKGDHYMAIRFGDELVYGETFVKLVARILVDYYRDY